MVSYPYGTNVKVHKGVIKSDADAVTPLVKLRRSFNLVTFANGSIQFSATPSEICITWTLKPRISIYTCYGLYRVKTFKIRHDQDTASDEIRIAVVVGGSLVKGLS